MDGVSDLRDHNSIDFTLDLLFDLPLNCSLDRSPVLPLALK